MFEKIYEAKILKVSLNLTHLLISGANKGLKWNSVFLPFLQVRSMQSVLFLKI